jgi:mycothiol system anti-sigma-R factor
MKQGECFFDEEELNLYLDGELDESRKSILDNHRLSCRDCASRYGIALKLKDLVKSSCSQYTAPVWLRDRVMAGITRDSRERAGGFWEYMRNLIGTRPMIPVGAAGFLVVVFLIALLTVSGPRGNMPLVTEMVNEHHEYLQEPGNLGIRSNDPSEIAQWISANAGMQFAIPSDPAIAIPGGACVLEEKGETIGCVFFDSQDKKISLFLTRGHGEKLFGPNKMKIEDISIYCGSCTGTNYVLWQASDLVCVLVGDLCEKSLVDIARHFI